MGRHLFGNRPPSVAAFETTDIRLYIPLPFSLIGPPVALEFGVDDIYISLMVEFYGHCLIKIAGLNQSEEQALSPTQEVICCSGVGNISQKNRYRYRSH